MRKGLQNEKLSAKEGYIQKSLFTLLIKSLEYFSLYIYSDRLFVSWVYVMLLLIADILLHWDHDF